MSLEIRILDWIIRLTGFFVIVTGLLWVTWSCLEQLLRTMRNYRILLEYAWHNKRIKEWLAAECPTLRHVPPSAKAKSHSGPPEATSYSDNLEP